MGALRALDCRDMNAAVETNLLCLFGRFAAEQKRTVTWEELLKDTRRAQPDLAGLKV